MPNSRCAFSRSLLAAIGFAAALDTAAAQSTPMSNDAIREAVSGATVHLDAPLGTTVPLEFNENGTVTGTAGRLTFYLGAAADTGRWWTANNRLCYRWTHWFNGEPSCMKIARQGAVFAWESDQGRAGTAKIVQRRAVVAAPPSAATAMVAAATAPAKLDTAKAEASRPSAPATPQRFAVAGSTVSPPFPAPATAQAGKVPPNMTKSAPTSSTPAAGPQLPPRAALGGPVAGSAAIRLPGAAKSAAAPAAAWETKVDARPAVQPPRAVASTPTVIQPAPRSQQSGPVVSGPVVSGPVVSGPVVSGPVMPGWRVVNVDEEDVLNVRAEPFAEAPVVGRIPPGGRGVKPLGTCYGAWCRVRWLGHDGWVHKAYVAPDIAH